MAAIGSGICELDGFGDVFRKQSEILREVLLVGLHQRERQKLRAKLLNTAIS